MKALSEYEIIRDFVSNKALLLMLHESKDSSHVGFPVSNFTVFLVENRDFYCIGTNIFREFIENDVLLYAVRNYPEKFGTGNAIDVVEALYFSAKETMLGLYENYKGRLSDFESLIRTAHAYIVDYTDSVLSEKILRLDLFRFLQKKSDSPDKLDFIGGLLHSFRHISVSGINLSSGNEKNVEIYHPIRIVDYIIKAFFFEDLEKGREENIFTSFIKFDDKYNLFFVFYHEYNSDVYFLKTIRKDKK